LRTRDRATSFLYNATMRYTSESLLETRAIAQDFLNTLTPNDSATVVALQGDLGAGKTAFSQAVGEIVGVKDNMQSPTFVIMKIYKIDWNNFKNLIHIDAYRLEREEELMHLGWQELIKEPENLVLIEWPENVAGIIPQSAWRINFKFINETIREIEL
jgi:tRNA threonylcarbamoyladenosine biosynthesis protein TsaE